MSNGKKSSVLSSKVVNTDIDFLIYFRFFWDLRVIIKSQPGIVYETFVGSVILYNFSEDTFHLSLKSSAEIGLKEEYV